ncbi:IS30 family transposase [Saccharopolyspora sp. NPDC003752]
MSNAEACRIVGINRRTGKKWRNGHHSPGKGLKPRPPANQEVPPSGPSRYLREEERIHIADRLREGAGIRTIAAELGRAPSTISREIRRNRHPGGAYRPHAAQARANARRPRPKTGKIAGNADLHQAVQALLDKKLSPEQIVWKLRRDFPGRPDMHVTHETIYQALYQQARGGLRRELAKVLRTGRVMRKRRRHANQRISRYTHPMVMITERPAEAVDRTVPGHWEGDLIIGKGHKSAIGTLVERSTRFVKLVHLPEGRTSARFNDALTKTITPLPAELRRSLTWDQGAEMAAHHAFSTSTGIPVYFCNPGSPWQRGSNENTNGLLRQYFPKGTDLARYDREHLNQVAAELNTRPRKTLGWDTPAERFARLLAASSN